MHIEPGVVDGAKMTLSYATGAASLAIAAKLAYDTIREDGGVPGLVLRSVAATLAVFVFFELLPHFAVGISEVHFILGTTLLLILGAGPAAIGLIAGLAIQGILFAPSDLPMYAVNVTTLIMPLWAIHELSRRMIPDGTAYVDLKYLDVLKLSLVYQGGIIAWVAFWALYGQGFGAENLTAVLSFGAAYLLVVVLEPLADLAVLWVAKHLPRSSWTTHRLHGAA
ncbi:MAG: energy-coupling factor ABC transporter permease [Pseudomonadota bacterium]